MAFDHDRLREQLVDLAREAMDRGGLEAVKARTLASEAGVSVGTIYNVFGDLDGLILHANAKTFGNLLTAARSAIGKLDMPDTGRSVDQVRICFNVLTSEYMDFVKRNSGSWNAALAFNQTYGGEQPEWYQEPQRGLLKLIAEIAGDLPGLKNDPDPEDTAWALWSSVHGIVSLGYTPSPGLEARRNVERRIDKILGPFLQAHGSP